MTLAQHDPAELTSETMRPGRKLGTFAYTISYKIWVRQPSPWWVPMRTSLTPVRLFQFC